MMISQRQPALSTVNGGLSGLPMWARLVAQFGLPSVLALALVYWTTVRVEQTQDQILREMPLRQREHKELLVSMTRSLEQQTILARYLRVLCVNAATTPDAMQRCAQVE